MNATVPLGEVVEIRSGDAPRRSVAEYWGGSIPLANVDDIKSTNLETTRESITWEGVKNSATSVVPAGSILVPTRKTVGRAAIAAVDMAIGHNTIAVLPGDGVDNLFLLHFLQFNARILQRRAQRNSLQAIGSKHLLSLELPIMEIDEQRRIADILDTADRIRRNFGKTKEMSERLLESVFLDSFGDPAVNSKGWPEYEMSELGEVHIGMRRSLNNKPVLFRKRFLHANDLGGVSEIGCDDMAPDTAAEIGLTQKEHGSEVLHKGDVLIVKRHRMSGEVGRATVWNASNEEYVHHESLIRFRADASKTMPEYISQLLNTRGGRRRLIPNDADLLQPFGISGRMVREMVVPVPPMELQGRFAKFLEMCRKIANNAERSWRNGNDLLASLSGRAFRGEL